MSDIEQIPDHFWDFMEDGDFTKFAKREGQMTDIVERLEQRHPTWIDAIAVMRDAKAEIERLREQVRTGLYDPTSRTATIEECAVIADKYKNSPSDAVAIAAKWIGDAIRALKEQP